MDRGARTFILLLAGSLSWACGGQGGEGGEDAASPDAGGLPSYAIDIELSFSALALDRGYVLTWADGYMGPAIERANRAAVRREFATREEALAFTGAFELTLGSRAPVSVDVRFSDCDEFLDAGEDPAQMRYLAKRYRVDDSLEAEANLAWTPATSCYRQVQQFFPGTPVDVRRMSFILATEGPVDVLRDGQSIPVAGVGRWGDVFLYEIFLDWPLEVHPSNAVAALGVLIDGVDTGEVEASFKGCATEPGDGGQYDPVNLREQRISLEVIDGELSLDTYDGCTCDFVLGSWSQYDACGDL